MAQYSWPFNSTYTVDENDNPVYDRACSADDIALIVKGIYTDGLVIPDRDEIMTYIPLNVTPNGGMTISVDKGDAIVQGRTYNNTTPLILTVTTAHASLPRKDMVVLRLSLAAEVRSVVLAIKAGTPASSPSEPMLTQNSTVWELGLATVYVAAGATSIGANSIVDVRAEMCGTVRPNVYPDGTLRDFIKDYTSTQRANFRANMDAVNKAGDTMAGNLEFSTPTGTDYIATILNRMVGGVQGRAYLEIANLSSLPGLQLRLLHGGNTVNSIGMMATETVLSKALRISGTAALIQTLTNLQIGNVAGLKIMFGSTMISAAANATTTIEVIWDKAFAASPYTIVGMNTSAPLGKHVSFASRTATGGVIAVANSTATTITITVYYIALKWEE